MRDSPRFQLLRGALRGVVRASEPLRDDAENFAFDGVAHHVCFQLTTGPVITDEGLSATRAPRRQATRYGTEPGFFGNANGDSQQLCFTFAWNHAFFSNHLILS